MAKYKRILLKFSGEALAGEDKFGINYQSLENFATEIGKIVDQGVQVGIVIGGGNIFRGAQGIKHGFSRVKGDYMGMLATVINAIAFTDMFNILGYKARVLTSTLMEPYAERYSPQRALDYLQKGEILLFAGGTSNPFFTTDSAAALRAVEINAEVLLKATNVDGVYSADPKLVPNAILYKQISFEQVIAKQLKVMDLTAFKICQENNLPIIVFNIYKKGSLLKIINGDLVGTLVS